MKNNAEYFIINLLVCLMQILSFSFAVMILISLNSDSGETFLNVILAISAFFSLIVTYVLFECIDLYETNRIKMINISLSLSVLVIISSISYIVSCYLQKEYLIYVSISVFISTVPEDIIYLIVFGIKKKLIKNK